MLYDLNAWSGRVNYIMAATLTLISLRFRHSYNSVTNNCTSVAWDLVHISQQHSSSAVPIIRMVLVLDTPLIHTSLTWQGGHHQNLNWDMFEAVARGIPWIKKSMLTLSWYLAIAVHYHKYGSREGQFSVEVHPQIAGPHFVGTQLVGQHLACPQLAGLHLWALV